MTTGNDTARTTIVVVTWRGREHVAACLDAVAAQTRPHRILVVDNASDDGTADVLATCPARPEVTRLPVNTGYAGGLAAALPAVTTEFVAWLNDDAVPAPDWLALLEDALDAAPAAAAAGARLESADGEPISVGVALTADGHGRDRTEPAGVFGFCGGAALLRTADLVAAGGVPARFFCYYEDTDTSWRLRLRGREVLAVPAARVVHRHGASSRPGSRLFHRWNERNRLFMLLRCAPAGVAARELARFAGLTAVLPVRRLARRPVPAAWNFRLGLRLQVLAEVLVRLAVLVRERRAVTRAATVARAVVWRSALAFGESGA
ncbi:MAG TPA: glycosyltransferase [Actinophytocola sp.]|nr:glycosyltransferase [Actinophytocola sp.]